MSSSRSDWSDVTGALFGDLDDATRHRFGIGKGEQTRAETRARSAEERATRSDKLPRQVVAPARPDAAQTPWQFTRGDWWQVGKRTFAQIGEDRVMSVAGGVTFFGLLALFPAITALVSLFGLFADPVRISENLDLLRDFLPEDAIAIIATQVEKITSAPAVSLSIASLFALGMAFYSANGGMKAIIEALNVAFFKAETRSFIKLNLTAMAFTLGGMLMIVMMIGVIAVIPAILAWVPMTRAAEWALFIVRWPIMLALLMLALSALYRWGPNKADSRWQWISPGAIFAALGLMVASMLFSWYAANFADYNETYGSLGAVILLMMWLWIASMVVMMGAEINSEVERQLRILNGLPVPVNPMTHRVD
ncbi:MAG: YihY/virulence factor BrkB family protein [Paracoccus sp. (in: a-proteobacteria)]|uniref:YihY/virulence factor BrkB family protein n=1 Tax=Paracoccus sp. TaxID=267 RepID=UPI0026DED384|nr:YihY/virulence factor BrkB family protein [Paracoccus sp. (in: a-proteobacteria)]MDO5612863.1 YihY/virulence factor BrkB family protein [Paracoccus sp. (in: a-proteobacteria)]